MPPREAEPRPPDVAPSFIFTRDELRRLFKVAGVGRTRCSKLDAETFRTFLLLLYGAGLRSGEARRLTVADVDLDSTVLTVNDSKFYKSRLVPVGADLAGLLRRYAATRARRPFRGGTASAFLACRDGSPLGKAIVGHAFRTTLRAAGISSSKPGCRRAGRHSLRHSFATPPPDPLVSRGGRRASPPAGPLDLSRPRQRGSDAGLYSDDPGIARRGQPSVRTLQRTKTKPGCWAASAAEHARCLNSARCSAPGSSAS